MKINIVSASETLVNNKEISAVYVPTSQGVIGILPGHTNLIATLEIGLIKLIENDGKTTSIVVNGGVIEVNNNSINILANEAELADHLVRQKINLALEEAEKKKSGPLAPSELIELEKQLRYERFKQEITK